MAVTSASSNYNHFQSLVEFFHLQLDTGYFVQLSFNFYVKIDLKISKTKTRYNFN